MVPEPMLRSVKLDTSVIFPHYQNTTTIPSNVTIQIQGTVLPFTANKYLLRHDGIKCQTQKYAKYLHSPTS